MAKDNKTSRQRLLEQARGWFPDRTFADLDATEPVEGAADLDDAISEKMEDLLTRQAEYDAQDQKLRKLYGTDPQIAEVLNAWIETGDPRLAIVQAFGDELGMSDEAKERFGTQLTEWRTRKEANDALSAESESNWQQSLEELNSWGDANNVDFDTRVKIMVRLLGVTFNGVVNRYGPDDFDMALHSMNYDADVAAARAAGEVAGRNEKIAATRRASTAPASIPPAGGIQGARFIERKPKSDEEESIWNNLSD